MLSRHWWERGTDPRERQKALLLLAIDGCNSDCAKKVLERAAFTEFIHLRVTDLGMVKGETPVTEERVCRVVTQAAALLGVQGGAE